MRVLTALALALVVVVAGAGVAQAAPAEQLCDPAAGGIAQHDFAGVYVSAVHQMRVEVFPCGGIFLQWTNPYGDHHAVYVTQRRLGDGTIIAEHARAERLDGSYAMGLKPAEPGYVQLITADRYGSDVRIYRLRKFS